MESKVPVRGVLVSDAVKIKVENDLATIKIVMRAVEAPFFKNEALRGLEPVEFLVHVSDLIAGAWMNMWKRGGQQVVIDVAHQDLNRRLSNPPGSDAPLDAINVALSSISTVFKTEKLSSELGAREQSTALNLRIPFSGIISHEPELEILHDGVTARYEVTVNFYGLRRFFFKTPDIKLEPCGFNAVHSMKLQFDISVSGVESLSKTMQKGRMLTFGCDPREILSRFREGCDAGLRTQPLVMPIQAISFAQKMYEAETNYSL